MTATERARQINDERSEGTCRLVEDAKHWADISVFTGLELDRYLAIELWVGLYKDVHGRRPRGVSPSPDDVPIETIEEWIEELSIDFAGQRLAEQRLAEQPLAEQDREGGEESP